MGEELDDSTARDIRLMDGEDKWGYRFVVISTNIVVLLAHLKQTFLDLGSFPPDAQGRCIGRYSPRTKGSALSTYSMNSECLVFSPVV